MEEKKGKGNLFLEKRVGSSDNADPSTSTNQLIDNVPTPFKKALFWPDPKPNANKRNLRKNTVR